MKTVKVKLAFSAAIILAALSGAAHGEAWSDKSPHKELSLRANGVRLNFLDWGGQGSAILFLPGLGDTAHVYDELAPRFTNHFHVLALTRRGSGKSEKPEAGYDTETLVEDVSQFLDGLKLKKVILVGHSIAGNELTRFAGLHPERVLKMVYLDAAYDRSGLMEILAKSPPEPQPTPTDTESVESYVKWSHKLHPIWSEACEASLRDGFVTPNPNVVTWASSASHVSLSLLRGAVHFHPDYKMVEAPVLAFFAFDDHAFERWESRMPGANEAARQQARLFQQLWREEQLRQIDRFQKEMKKGRVIKMPDTIHLCFIQRQSEIVRLMDEFLAEK